MSVPHSRPERTGIREDRPSGIDTDDLSVDPDLWAYQENDTSDDPRASVDSVTICWAVERDSSESIETETYVCTPGERIGPLRHEEYPLNGHVTTSQWASAFASTDGGFTLDWALDVVEKELSS